jgi:hypothetical protein
MISYNINRSYFGDLRLDKRMGKIMNQLSTEVGGSIPICGVVWGQTKGIYRFLDNDKVSYKKIIAVEQNRLLSYIAQTEDPVLYHLHDTTTLNYSHQKGRFDLGCLNYVDHRGFFAHTSLLLDSKKVVQGVLDLDLSNRLESTLGSARNNDLGGKSFPIELKESYRWISHFATFQALVSLKPDCHGISISDAESDFYELFATKTAKNVDIIARLQHNHKVEEETSKVLEVLSKQPSSGLAWIEVLKSDKHNTRNVELEIRYKKVSLPLPPSIKWSSTTPDIAKSSREKVEKQGPLTLYAVQAKEINAPDDEKPIEWTVLTTICVTNYWDALDVIQKYAIRWDIEVYHIALKEGFAVEKLQLETHERLENAIALYCILAAQIVQLRYLAENCPNKPIKMTGFSNENYAILVSFLAVNYNVKLPTPDEPTVEQFTKAIIILGGGKSKKIGIRQLWKGLAKADMIFKTVIAIKKE